MCLVTNQKHPLVAEKDIKVYKVVEKRDGLYYSPFRTSYTYGHLNKPMGREVSEDSYRECEVWLWNNKPKKIKCKEITGGYIHAYLSFMAASNTCDNLNRDYCYLVKRYKIFEMTIPKGAKYYKSYDNREICADTLIWENYEKQL